MPDHSNPPTLSLKSLAVIWSLGFRPLFLGGTLWSVVMIALWSLHYAGWLRMLPANRNPINWHAHEMLFGFVSAIIAGFILTASQNWTGKRGVHGLRLQFLVAIWLSARLASIIPGVPYELYAALDILFWPVLLALLWPYLGVRTQRRNQAFFIFFMLMFAAALLSHADEWSLLKYILPDTHQAFAPYGHRLAIDTILLIIALIGGRIIPLFTRNAIADAQPVSYVWLDRAAFLVLAIWLVLDVLQPYSRWTAIAAAVVTGVHALRFSGWQFWKTVRKPIVLVLHCGYAWLLIGWALKALQPISALHAPLATHALTAGGMGVMIYAMITRVSLGHTARPIQADSAILAGYVLINVAVILRVLAPMISMQNYNLLVGISGVVWSIAFVLFLWRYSGKLISPRLDGKPG
ncbi:MAG: NnrS family protein [Leptospiraceae bacterium]|nr:NnrS family protein [Leptospiraceae bacterium]